MTLPHQKKAGSKGAPQASAVTDEYQSEIRRLLREQIEEIDEINEALHDLSTETLAIITSCQPILEELRKTFYPRPTRAETTRAAIKHLVTEFRTLLEAAIENNPELRKTAKLGLSRAIEKGQQFMTSLEGSPNKPATDANEPASSPQAEASESRPSVSFTRADTLQDLEDWITELGRGWMVEFCARHNVHSDDTLTFGHIAEIRAAAMKKRQEAKP